MTLRASATGSESWPVYTARRKPSAAAMTMFDSSSLSSTPVSTGRDSSEAAENATSPMPWRSTEGSMLVAKPESTWGMGGKSSADAPLM